MGYRFAFDIGTNSIGWAVLDLGQDNTPCSITDLGVRIYSDGRNANKTKASLAETRRLARSARRNRDRSLQRRKKLMDLLVRHGLMPERIEDRKNLESHDPYALRATGLDQPLPPHNFGRALFHLNQRRGFKSNRKTDKKDKDQGLVRTGIEALRTNMQKMNARTFGEFLHKRRQQGQTVLARTQGIGKEIHYEFYPDRELLLEEFQILWQAQEPLLRLGEQARLEIEQAIFFQNPLKPVNPGRCTFFPDEYRAPKALPLAQRFRIYQDLNHLRVLSPGLESRSLTLAERDKLAGKLLRQKTMSLSAVRTIIKLDAEHEITLPGNETEKLVGDPTTVRLATKENFGPAWFDLSLNEQNKLVRLLLDTQDEGSLVETLQERWNLTPEQAQNLADLPLPDGYGRLGEKALALILAQLEKAVIPYSQAVLDAGLGSHSDLRTGEILDRLPYYGKALQRRVAFGTGDPADKQEARYGRIANPTVHIALNQLRVVTNTLLKTYGHPEQIVVEVARDLKNSIERRKEIEKEQKKNRESNEKRLAEVAALGIENRGDALLRMRLWEELSPDAASRRCPYTGEQISLSRLFDDEVEIEHILPFARTLDDSPANKTVSLRRANRYKGNQTPFEAFGESRDGYDWSGIAARALHLPNNKSWRFQPDALERIFKDRDFLSRQLTDTQYIAVVAREYLECICDPKTVWATPGRLTSMLSRHWGLPPKNRQSHRHHAVDAALIGVTDRALLQRISTLHACDVEQGLRRFLAGLDAPWPTFREDVLAKAESMIISHRPDHGVQKRFLKDTAYAVLGKNGEKGNASVRKDISTFAKPEDLLKVKGRNIRARLLGASCGVSLEEALSLLDECDALGKRAAPARLKQTIRIDDKDFKNRLQEYAQRRNLRRVKIRDTLPLIPIKDKSGQVYKGYESGGNAYYDIRLAPDGKWVGEIVSAFDANRPEGFTTGLEKQGLPLVMKLFNGDMLELTHEGEQKIFCVVKQSQGKISLAEHHEADVAERKCYFTRSPGMLQKQHARPLFVDPIGRVRRLEVPNNAAANRGDQR
ncbi:MAG: type II CRISPR RNA-guided endonuclease Cas9 [Desulfovibrio sp.]